ncbi:MAG: hypothetical protein E7Z89_02785 [Cyanobacteria bacterium SIG28]|nr:hypothetical protein [Cyanobacteria bacterium SIG28]
MKYISRCIPMGALPYEDETAIIRMMTKLFVDIPFLPLLPKMEPDNTLFFRTLDKVPGIVMHEKGFSLKPRSKALEAEFAALDKTFNNPSMELLDAYAVESVFMEKYLEIIKKFKPKEACINFLGPFTISQMLNGAADDQLLLDKYYRKIFIQAVCVKALWAIEKVKQYCPTTKLIIIFEEPLLNKFGVLKRENEEVTSELITNLFSRVIEKIHSAGALVAIHCNDKCDWRIPIDAEVDIVSFDAYNNPNSLSIIPEAVENFLAKGGRINWGIVPVMTENMVKTMTIDLVAKRFFATLDSLIKAGVPSNLVYNTASVSLQGDVDKLPLLFSEKALMIEQQLSKKIPLKQ